MKGMKRLDWPDEKGWWWVETQGSESDCYPVHFTGHEIDKTLLAWHKDSKFIGPIPEPKVPMKIQFDGRVSSIVYNCCTAASVDVRINTLCRVTSDAQGKLFQVTLEELL